MRETSSTCYGECIGAMCTLNSSSLTSAKYGASKPISNASLCLCQVLPLYVMRSPSSKQQNDPTLTIPAANSVRRHAWASLTSGTAWHPSVVSICGLPGTDSAPSVVRSEAAFATGDGLHGNSQADFIQPRPGALLETED